MAETRFLLRLAPGASACTVPARQSGQRSDASEALNRPFWALGLRLTAPPPQPFPD
jgi:hypothetical protein